jgi:hypothetical protein
MRGLADTCDVCGKIKGATNHWFGFRLHPTLGTLVVIAFSKIPEEEVKLFKLTCGSGCLLKRVSELVVTL